MFILCRDGAEVLKFRDYISMLRYFHSTHGYSFDHGCKHEGYSWAEVPNDA